MKRLYHIDVNTNQELEPVLLYVFETNNHKASDKAMAHVQGGWATTTQCVGSGEYAKHLVESLTERGITVLR